MGRAHDAEVAMIDGRYVGDVESFGGRDDGGIYGAERKVVVLRDELGDSDQVDGVNSLEGEVAGCEVTKETDFRLPTEVGRDEVGDFGENERWDDQRARVGLQELEARRMVGVVTIEVGVQRAGVDDQRDESTSTRRISSIRSEISAWPLRPAAAASKRRRWAGEEAFFDVLSDRTRSAWWCHGIRGAVNLL